jgi:hypothetical protein
MPVVRARGAGSAGRRAGIGRVERRWGAHAGPSAPAGRRSCLVENRAEKDGGRLPLTLRSGLPGSMRAHARRARCSRVAPAPVLERG